MEIPKLPKPEKEELALAKKLIESMDKKFKPEQFKDIYRIDLEKYLDKKAKGKTVTLNQAETTEKSPKGKVVNLVDRLKNSLKDSKSSKRKSKKVESKTKTKSKSSKKAA